MQLATQHLVKNRVRVKVRVGVLEFVSPPSTRQRWQSSQSASPLRPASIAASEGVAPVCGPRSCSRAHAGTAVGASWYPPGWSTHHRWAASRKPTNSSRNFAARAAAASRACFGLVEGSGSGSG